jgi:hypothetical protein
MYDGSDGNLVNLRKAIFDNNLEMFEYMLHPVAGNIIAMELQDSPDLFWKTFTSLPQKTFEPEVSARIFTALDNLNFSCSYLSELLRHCSRASLPILYWVVSRLARCETNPGHKVLARIDSRNVNQSARKYFISVWNSIHPKDVI